MTKKIKNINVLPWNEHLLETFVYRVYGSPNSWSGGPNLLVKGYPDFEIKSEKGIFDRKYKTKIILKNSLSKYEIEKLTYVARTENLSFSDIDRIAQEAKKDLSWKFRWE